MCDPPRIVCATCGADLGPATLVRAGHSPTEGWVWAWPDDLTHTCPSDQEDPAP